APVAVAMEYGRGRGLIRCVQKPSVDALVVRDVYPDLFSVRGQRPTRPRNIRLRMVRRHEFETSHNEENNHDYKWQIDQHANPFGEPGNFSWFREPVFHDSRGAKLERIAIARKVRGT